LALFGRRPPERVDDLGIPASENLHTNGLMHRSKQQPYSINSSARASTACGITIQIALAVLRLITNWYLVGACTRRSAGFSPLRMRST